MGTEELEVDLSRLNAVNPLGFIRVFLGEDFNFGTGVARSRININTGKMRIKRYSNGARTITLDASSGGIPITGSWTGMLVEGRLIF